jgi:hypothetical protein
VPAWRFPAEEEVSDDESEVVRMKQKVAVKVMPYRMVNEPIVEYAESSHARNLWAYEVPVEGQHVREKRKAGSWMLTDRGKEAADLLRARFLAVSDDYGVTAMKPPVKEEEADEVVVIDVEPVVTARSPGGTGVVELKAEVYGKLARGEALAPKVAVSLLRVLDEAKAVVAFTKTTVFDGWAPPWISLWATFSRQEVLKECVAGLVHGVVMRLIQAMYTRFREEAVHFFCTSNVYRDKVKTLFSKSVSINKLAKQIREGRVGIAQSDRFVDRWLLMLDMHEKVLSSMEKAHVFDPLSVTKVQDTLPIDRGGRRRVVALPEQFANRY